VGALALLRPCEALGLEGAHDAPPAGAGRRDRRHGALKPVNGYLQRGANGGLCRVGELDAEVGQRLVSLNVLSRTNVNHDFPP
jgi:hypothetical protein